MKTIARRAGLAAATLTVAAATVMSASGAASASHWNVDAATGGITIQINHTEWINWIYKKDAVCGAMVPHINERRHGVGVTRDLTLDECTHAVGNCIANSGSYSFNALYMFTDNTYYCTTWTGPDAND
jgi:hypothetical protein